MEDDFFFRPNVTLSGEDEQFILSEARSNKKTPLTQKIATYLRYPPAAEDDEYFFTGMSELSFNGKDYNEFKRVEEMYQLADDIVEGRSRDVDAFLLVYNSTLMAHLSEYLRDRDLDYLGRDEVKSLYKEIFTAATVLAYDDEVEWPSSVKQARQVFQDLRPYGAVEAYTEWKEEWEQDHPGEELAREIDTQLQQVMAFANKENLYYTVNINSSAEMYSMIVFVARRQLQYQLRDLLRITSTPKEVWFNRAHSTTLSAKLHHIEVPQPQLKIGWHITDLNGNERIVHVGTNTGAKTIPLTEPGLYRAFALNGRTVVCVSDAVTVKEYATCARDGVEYDITAPSGCVWNSQISTRAFTKLLQNDPAFVPDVRLVPNATALAIRFGFPFVFESYSPDTDDIVMYADGSPILADADLINALIDFSIESAIGRLTRRPDVLLWIQSQVETFTPSVVQQCLRAQQFVQMPTLPLLRAVDYLHSYGSQTDARFLSSVLREMNVYVQQSNEHFDDMYGRSLDDWLYMKPHLAENSVAKKRFGQRVDKARRKMRALECSPSSLCVWNGDHSRVSEIALAHIDNTGAYHRGSLRTNTTYDLRGLDQKIVNAVMNIDLVKARKLVDLFNAIVLFAPNYSPALPPSVSMNEMLQYIGD